MLVGCVDGDELGCPDGYIVVDVDDVARIISINKWKINNVLAIIKLDYSDTIYFIPDSNNTNCYSRPKYTAVSKVIYGLSSLGINQIQITQQSAVIPVDCG